jgi:D-serine deaminase-like pyridoxal phosphate-dependent protein
MDKGGPHPPYFAALNDELKRNGPGRPVIVIDRDRLRANVERVRAKLPQGQAFRVVSKSLPALSLLQDVMGPLGTQRLMVFHEPHLRVLGAALPEADLLLGKPMPVAAMATFFKEQGPAERVTWLVDSVGRLLQYQQLARERGVKLKLNAEIDVGLHRGGLTAPEQLAALIERVKADPDHLELTGLMGYDAQVGKIPAAVESTAQSFKLACERYTAFKAKLREVRPDALFDGGGSRTVRLHGDGKSPLNEVAAGSCFVKPLDFEAPTLDDLEPAAFIAAPVLKVLDGTTLPGLDRSNALWPVWDRNRQRTFFIYGGLYPGEYVSPPGLLDNPLYGRSSNQAMVNGSQRVPLEVDDYVFLRPTQSEKVLLDYGALAVVEGGKLSTWWPALPS